MMQYCKTRVAGFLIQGYISIYININNISILNVNQYVLDEISLDRDCVRFI